MVRGRLGRSQLIAPGAGHTRAAAGPARHSTADRRPRSRWSRVRAAPAADASEPCWLWFIRRLVQPLQALVSLIPSATGRPLSPMLAHRRGTFGSAAQDGRARRQLPGAESFRRSGDRNAPIGRLDRARLSPRTVPPRPAFRRSMDRAGTAPRASTFPPGPVIAKRHARRVVDNQTTAATRAGQRRATIEPACTCDGLLGLLRQDRPDRRARITSGHQHLLL